MPLLTSQVIPQSGPERAAVGFTDFTGGLCVLGNGIDLADNQSPDACNVDPQPLGGLCIRRGVKPYHTNELPAEICHIWYSEFVGKDPCMYASLKDGTVWAIWGEPCEAVAQQVTEIPPATDPENCCWRGIQSQESLYIYNGIDPPYAIDPDHTVRPLDQEWNTVTLTFENPTTGEEVEFEDYSDPNEGSMPIAKFAATHSGFLWMASTTEDGVEHCNRIRRSFPVQDGTGPEDWNENDYIDIDVGADGDCITGIVACGDRLYVFKRCSMYQIIGYNEDNLEIIPISRKIGAVSCDAITCCDGRAFFFDGNQGLTSIGANAISWHFAKVFNLLKDCVIPPEEVDNVTVGVCNRRIWVSVPSIPATYVFDLTLGESGSWTKYDLALGDFEMYCPKDGANICLAALKDPCNFLVKLDVKDQFFDNFGCETRSIRSWWRTGWFGSPRSSIPNPFTQKEWCGIDVVGYGDPGFGLDISYYADQNRNQGIGQGKVDLSSPVGTTFMIGTSCLAQTQYIKLTPDSEPIQNPWPVNTETEDCLAFEEKQKVKQCVKPLPEVDSCSLQLLIEGPMPSREWCICTMLIQYKERPVKKRG